MFFKISRIINNTLTEAETSYKQQNTVNVELSEKLRNLCQSGFKKLVFLVIQKNHIIRILCF